ncbi:bifunctional adenosylcobinamide kinase/adenosylcobinamide-phosphate guanylyltransferase [Simiduia sp. 21SJ11W-1]|uniref:bifunctional adenosylcobinamide kinase/adenosylcobinamide-phosphate guanylyltransferase n=1 Tax=Simiduia sp. 21SJ11W-1 TaxID=2909669 RepID=UPI00209D4012|nr:bifunctional adenosylcobinamide kinase/adenosylcobinamide-phosphate guanylyltransferase [Simiduia sp. 21SJ11W-1]UTA47684.1 bifunctional adenosylcobinamide kinase/adenosylcobinamide-phosphate guanylyltransferase [Simiduia sp. 21SJ11W-1]
MKQLILGGARSGKSRYGEQQVLAQARGLQPVYIATASEPESDAEMAQRIAKHRVDRGEQWQCIEEPLHLGALIERLHSNSAPVLVDCLTLWLSNCLLADTWAKERAHFLQAFAEAPGSITLISNEVGLGIVPMGEINRRFVDESGFLHQALAACCDRVVFCAAGLPMVLKDVSP